MSQYEGSSQNSGSVATALDSSSEFSQLLSSLGLSTTTQSITASDVGPDPLIVARAKLTKFKADLETTAQLLHQLKSELQIGSKTPVALRIFPPVKFATTTAPAVLHLSADGNDWRELSQNTDHEATYLPFKNLKQALQALRDVYSRRLNHFDHLRRDVVSQAQARINQTMQAFAASNQKYVVNEDGKALNEDGLPFVNPTEKVEETPESLPTGTRSSTIEQFQPTQPLTGEQRKRWIEDIFRDMEDEPEEVEAEKFGRDEEAVDYRRQLPARLEADHEQQGERDQKTSSNLHGKSSATSSELSSGTNFEKSLKPALKQSSVSTLQAQKVPPKFGQAGLRRGFLNMNPSSRAAIASSNSHETWKEGAVEDLTKSWACDATTAAVRDRQGENEVNAMTRSLDDTSSRTDKRKKSVKIRSLERSRSESLASTCVPCGGLVPSSHPDDVGVEDDAARIVKLLGPEVVQGTERGKEPFRLPQKQQQAAAETAVEKIQYTRRESQRNQHRDQQAPLRPALGTSVVERPARGLPRHTSKPESTVSDVRKLALKGGFLDRPCPPSSSLTPASIMKPAQNKKGPLESLNMSAFDRSLLSDEPLAAKREAQGLSSAMPHARPSKAFQEKLGKKRRGESLTITESSHEDNPQKQQLVDTGREHVGGGRKVRFQLGTSAVDQQSVHKSVADRGTGEGKDDDGLAKGNVEVPELDEHDEEAHARAAYSSGDFDDFYDDGGIDQAKGDSDDGHGSDWSLESYDYTPSDLADLESTFNGLVSDLESAELAREYALAKARQLQAYQNMSDESKAEMERAFTGERMKAEQRQQTRCGDSIWDEDDIDGRDIAAAKDMDDGLSVSERKKRSTEPPNRMSRFKASRIVQALSMGTNAPLPANRPKAPARWLPDADEEEMKTNQAGYELAHLLENAQNVGPSDLVLEETSLPEPSASAARSSTRHQGPIMVLPSLTPLRYPRSRASRGNLTEDVPILRDGVALEGETDEDEEDEVLMDVMRARLQDREERRNRAEDPATFIGPRAHLLSKVLPGRGWGIDKEDSDGGRLGGTSGRAMEAPPKLSFTSVKKADVSFKSAAVLSSIEPCNVSMQPSTAPSTDVAPSAPAPKMSRFKAARLAAQQR